MRRHSLPALPCALLLLGVTSGTAAATSATNVHKGTCTVDFPDYGASSGAGTLVTTSSGRLIFVCNLDVSKPPANTVVQTFPGTTGDVVVVTP